MRCLPKTLHDQDMRRELLIVGKSSVRIISNLKIFQVTLFIVSWPDMARTLPTEPASMQVASFLYKDD